MNLYEEVVTPTASLNILTLNFSAHLRLNYLIASTNKGTFVRLRVVVCKNRAEVLKIKKLKFFQTSPEHRYEWP